MALLSLPKLRTAHDPPIASVLWAVALAAVLGAVGSLPGHWSLADMLPIFGGVIVLLGSYFAARTLRENEMDRATAMLASGSAAVQLAGVHRLIALASEAPRYVPYVDAVLNAFTAEHADEPDAAHELALSRSQASS